MEKSDTSRHAICISAIKRHILKPYDFKWTKFYESNEDFVSAYAGFAFDLLNQERAVCSTILDDQNYTVLTTQRLIAKVNGVEDTAIFPDWKSKKFGSFKRDVHGDFTFATVEKSDNSSMRYLIETGNASMVMINGIDTMYGFAISQLDR